MPLLPVNCEKFISNEKAGPYVEYYTKDRTSFGKLKIMRTAIRHSTKKCDALKDECLSYNFSTYLCILRFFMFYSYYLQYPIYSINNSVLAVEQKTFFVRQAIILVQFDSF